MRRVLDGAVAAMLLLAACEQRKEPQVDVTPPAEAPPVAPPATGGDYRDLSPEGVPVRMRVPRGMSVQAGEVMLPQATAPARSVLLTKDAFQLRVTAASGVTLEQQLAALEGVTPASSGPTPDGWEIVVRHTEQSSGLWLYRRQAQVLCEAPLLASPSALKDARKLCDSAVRTP